MKEEKDIEKLANQKAVEYLNKKDNNNDTELDVDKIQQVIDNLEKERDKYKEEVVELKIRLHIIQRVITDYAQEKKEKKEDA